MSESYEELTKLSREELVKRHDVRAQHTQVGTAHYEDELRHRDQMGLLGKIAEHTSSMARCLDIIAMYFLARWKRESKGLGIIESPPNGYLEDPRNSINP